MRQHEVCLHFHVILENGCCSDWNWRSQICFEFEMEKQILDRARGSERVYKFKTYCLFYFIFNPNNESSYLIRRPKADVSHDSLRLWENIHCVHIFTSRLTSLIRREASRSGFNQHPHCHIFSSFCRENIAVCARRNLFFFPFHWRNSC